MNVYMGFDNEAFDMITPTAQQAHELHQIGFTTRADRAGWHAVFEVPLYRVQITPAGRGWLIANTRTKDDRVEAAHYRADLTDAITLAEDMALEVDLVDALAGMISAEVKAELRWAA